MSSAGSNTVQIRYMPEVIPGTTPTTGKAVDLRVLSDTLSFDVKTDVSKERKANRRVADLRPIDADDGGDLTIEFSFGEYDPLLEAATGGTWTANVLKDGLRLQQFSVEQALTDVSKYISHKGQAVSNLSLDFNAGALVTGSITMMGMYAFVASATQMPAGGTTPSKTAPVMNVATDFGLLLVDGVPADAGVSKISLKVGSNLRALKANGTLGATEIKNGQLAVTADVTAYFSTGSVYTKYLANEPITLSWQVLDTDGNGYQFSLPRTKASAAKINTGSLDSDVELTFTLTAIDGADSLIQITRVVADAP